MWQFLSGFEMVLHWHYVAYMFVGVAFGLLLGFLPGLHGGTGMALMLPFTYEMEALTSLVFLLSIYTGSLFGGAVTAILFNTPGTSANIATAFDGYPMSRSGQPGRALGLSLMSSFGGGVVGCACLLLLAEPMSRVSIRFGAAEIFMVAVFGLSMIGSLADNVLKSLYAGVFGILLGTVGMSASGVIRGTMGNTYLIDGIPLSATLVGLMALPEIFDQLASPTKIPSSEKQHNMPRQFLEGILETLRKGPRVLVSSLIGVFVGIMPAAGSTVASMLSYNQSKQFSERPELYGTGCPDGIIASEAANNASEGGALATMYILGIPGSGGAALVLAALVLQGWLPGPQMFLEHSEILYASISSLFLQQFVMLLLGGVFCLLGTQIVRLPLIYLMPCILVFTFLGAYSTRYLLFDSGLMLFFCAIGWLMKRNGYPLPPLVLGLLLGSIADTELMRVYQGYDHFYEIFGSPIVCLLALASAAGVAYPAIAGRSKKRNAGM